MKKRDSEKRRHLSQQIIFRVSPSEKALLERLAARAGKAGEVNTFARDLMRRAVLWRIAGDGDKLQEVLQGIGVITLSLGDDAEQELAKIESLIAQEAISISQQMQMYKRLLANALALGNGLFRERDEARAALQVLYDDTPNASPEVIAQVRAVLYPSEGKQ